MLNFHGALLEHLLLASISVRLDLFKPGSAFNSVIVFILIGRLIFRIRVFELGFCNLATLLSNGRLIMFDVDFA